MSVTSTLVCWWGRGAYLPLPIEYSPARVEVTDSDKNSSLLNEKVLLYRGQYYKTFYGPNL
jgi:hypothetical protein